MPTPPGTVDDNGDKGGDWSFMAEAVAAHTPLNMGLFLQISNNVVAGPENNAFQVALAAAFAEEQDAVRAAELTDVVDKARMMLALERVMAADAGTESDETRANVISLVDLVVASGAGTVAELERNSAPSDARRLRRREARARSR